MQESRRQLGIVSALFALAACSSAPTGGAGSTAVGGAGEGGRLGSGGITAVGGATSNGGQAGASATGGSSTIGAGGGAPTSDGAAGARDAGLGASDAADMAFPDAAGGDAQFGDAAGFMTGGAAGGTTASGNGGSAAGGVSGSGGEGGGVAACASNEFSKCARGDGPFGPEIKCDFGGSDGNYDVTLEVGGTTSAEAFVDAEMYRRMLPDLTTLAGQTQRFNFTVNVRTPEGQPVEVGTTDSVPGLQVYVRGASPIITSICHQSASKPLMLWIGGDSTVCDQDSTNYTGWGQHLPQFMKAGVSIANYADSGESSGSFLSSAAMFGAIKSRWKAGDWFFIQLGHNDKSTTAATFQSNMTSYVTQAKAAGVNIVLITPISRVGYTLAEEHVNSTGANLPQIIRDLGKSENVPVIDLTVTTWNWIQTITPKDYFAADSSASGGYDHTHLGPKGADAVASFVRDAVKSTSDLSAVAAYLR